MPSPSPRRQRGNNGHFCVKVNDKLAIQRSLQEAAEGIKARLQSEDCLVKGSVSDSPESMRQIALSSCRSPPSDWQDTTKPSVLQLWNSYWEKDAYNKRVGQWFFYKSYSGETRVVKLDPFATIAEVEEVIEQHEGEALPKGSLKSGGKSLIQKHLDLNDYHVNPGTTFELPSRLCGGGNVVARTDRGPSRPTTESSVQPANSPVSTSMGGPEASLPRAQGDPPESLRAQQEIAAARDGQDSAGVAQAPEPEPEPESDMDTTSGSETTHADPHALMLRPQEQDDPTALSKPNPSISTSKDSPVERAVSLRWLQRFVTKNSSMSFSFTRKEYVDVADGGGNQHGIDIAAENLDAFRLARRAAERAGSGKPVMVRYVDIPFEDMTTADVMEAIIRPVCRKHHKSYAEAVIMLDAVGFIGDPTYFVSTFPNSFVTGECCLMLPSLAIYCRLHTHGTACLSTCSRALALSWRALLKMRPSSGLYARENSVFHDQSPPTVTVLSNFSTLFVEQDIFAINQDDSGGKFSAMDELDAGKTLARVIELSRSTLVVLDRERAAPLARLWCADGVFA